MHLPGTACVVYLVEFTACCVSNFERLHHSRITSETTNTLFVIGDVKLVFMDKSSVSQKFGIDITQFNPRLNLVPVLRVNQAFVYDMDQVESNRKFPFFYQSEAFIMAALKQ